MNDPVIIDTCIWASFFAKPHSPEKRAVDALLDTDRVVVIGPILAEVLIGFRRREQADWVASRLRMAHQELVGWEDWCQAASIGRRIAATTHGVPNTDPVVAAVAIRTSLSVYTIDPYFNLFPGVRRFQPN